MKKEKKGIWLLDKYKQKISKTFQILKSEGQSSGGTLSKRNWISRKIKAASFDYANIIVDGIFDLEQIARENETKNALNAIDKEYNYKFEQAKGNATIEAALEKKKER